MSQTNHRTDPIRPGGGMRRLRQGNLRRREDQTTVVNRIQFQALLQSEIDRALSDELTLVVMRLRLRPLPGAGDDGYASRDLPNELVKRLEQCHEHLRVTVANPNELMLFVPSLRRRPDGETLVSSLLEILSNPIEIDGLPHHLSATIGAAMLDRESPSADLLIEGSRLALTESDSANPGTIFHPYQRVRHDRRKEIENDLRTAVVNRDITAALQPAYRIDTGELVGFEAFARWNRVGKGPVPAVEFVHMAHELGIDHYLSRQVLDQSLASLGAILDDRPELENPNYDPTLWLNVSPDEVLHPEFVNTIVSAMNTDVRFRVGLELSPSPPSDARDVHHSLKQLVAHGARVAIGDFGIGNANLTVLQQLPFDAVKLDRALIRQIAGNDAAAEMVKALIEMAALLDLETTAQGVENVAQLKVLSGLGCSIAQGYFYGEPTGDRDTVAGWFEPLTSPDIETD